MTSRSVSRSRRRKNLKSSRSARANWFYTRMEVRDIYGISPNTLRNWMKQGLRPIEPEGKLFLGSDLNAFHAWRRKEVKTPCQPYEVFFTSCKSKHSLLEAPFEVDYAGRYSNRIFLNCPETGKRTSAFVRKTVLEVSVVR
ncbi:hypothetical protein IWQ51_001685 [Labrenzia sp. EL_142]|nr:hypothetical protein [Labrenzia sp. EL_142]